MIEWYRINNSSESYRFEEWPIRATYGKYEKGRCHWTANQCLNKNSPFMCGDCDSIEEARLVAERAIEELRAERAKISRV